VTRVRQQVELITLGVSDLAVSRRFYLDGLGWQPTLDLPGIVFLQVGHGLLLGLFPAEELAADVRPGLRPAAAGPGRFSLAHTVASPAEVDRSVTRAVQAGGTLLKAPQRAKAFGGYHAYLADPDGFWWEIAYNPGLRVMPDGRVVIEPIAG
jgi:catechol 2,3-dioxygenase-like lactoylglutathione lyase family enzyme